MIVTIVLVTVASMVVIHLWKQHRLRSKLPPGPSGWPLIGSALDIDQKHPHLTITEWSHQYGDVYTFNLMGTHVVVLNSAEAIQVIFDTAFECVIHSLCLCVCVCVCVEVLWSSIRPRSALFQPEEDYRHRKKL